MERQKGIKALSVVALLIAVVGLTVAFAAMSRTLTINGTATMDTATWDVHFEDLELVTKDGAAEITTAPTIKTNENGDELSAIGDFKVVLTKPNDKITYKFTVVNDGTINAKIENIEVPTPTCSPVTGELPEGDVAASAEDAATVCENITYSLTDAEGNDITGHTLAADGGSKEMYLTLQYNDVNELPTANTSVAIDNLAIDLLYIQD